MVQLLTANKITMDCKFKRLNNASRKENGLPILVISEVFLENITILDGTCHPSIKSSIISHLFETILNTRFAAAGLLVASCS